MHLRARPIDGSRGGREGAWDDGAWHAELDHSEWNFITRGETQTQRLDRNFLEILQEVRVVQTGIQILFAFLLGFAFTARFPTLPGQVQGIYLATLVLAAVTAGLLIAPVSHHRVLFRRRLKSQMVDTAHRLVTAGLVCLWLTLLGAVDLAATLVIGQWAMLLTATLGLTLALFWWGLPLHQRSRHPRRNSLNTERSVERG
jgi:hypothetical protein